MNIAQTHFWIDRSPRSIGIRSSNRKTFNQTFEASLSRYWALLDFHIYEAGREAGGNEYRLSFRLLWLTLNIHLCNGKRRGGEAEQESKRWGWYCMDRRSIILNWARRSKTFDFPIVSLIFQRHEILSMSRNRIVYVVPRCGVLSEWEDRKEIVAQHSAQFPYRYECLNGEIQDVIATINVERRVWRRKWTPFKHVSESIDVHFSEEVGPERGSWKGGCIGCGHTLKPKETAIQCLRRMERERRFER